MEVDEPTAQTRFNHFTSVVDLSGSLIRHTQRGLSICEHKVPAPRHIDSPPTVCELGVEIEKMAQNFQILSFQLIELASMMEIDENIEPNTEECGKYKTLIQNTFNVMRPLSQACKLLATFVIPLGQKPRRQPSGKHGRELKILPKHPQARAARQAN